MTLDTRVYVVDHVEPMELFRQCQALLTPYDADRRPPERQRWREDAWSGDGRVLMNEGMQGLPAWLIMHHGGERPYRTPERAAKHDLCNVPGADYYDPNERTCTGEGHPPACWYEVSYDTAYGYRGPDSMGCGDLHARLVAELGLWLDARGVRWLWLNEFTGEVHAGYEALIELASAGFEASAWYRTKVLPALAGRRLDSDKEG